MVPPELQEIADVLAERLGRSVAIDDPHLKLLAHTPHRSEAFDSDRMESIMQKQAPEEVVQHLRRQTDVPDAGYIRIRSDTDSAGLERVCVPIRYRAHLFGYLWLLDPHRTLSHGDLQASVAAAVAAGEVLYREQHLDEEMLEWERGVADDLIDPDQTRRGAAVSKLTDARYALSTSKSVTAIVIYTTNTEGGDHSLIDVSLARLTRSLPRTEYLVTESDGARVILVGAQTPERDTSADVARRITAALRKSLPPDAEVWAGVGPSAAGPDLLHSSFRHAVEAARVAEAIPELRPVARWHDLGIYRLLAQLDGDEAREAAIPEGFRRLLADDKQHVLSLTLEVYLDEAANVPRTTERLSIHRTSLYYRLNRIEQITGMSLSDGDDRLSLHISLKLSRLLMDHRWSEG